MYRNISGICLTLLLPLLLCTCGPALNSQKEATVVAGTIRYQQDNKLLEATLRIEPVDSSDKAVYPTLFGTAMTPAPMVGPGRFRTRRSLTFPTTFRLTAPCPEGPNCPLDYGFSPPFSDSIPSALTLGKSARFPVANTGLAADESLVLFFEPADRSEPRRVQLLGPTSSGQFTLRKEVFSDIPVGSYEVYLVKQQLKKDSTGTIIASLQTEYFTKAKTVEIME